MAVSAADKPIYVPQVRPQVSDPTSELAHVADWSAREFDNVSRGLVGGVPRWNLQTINAPPSRPRTGDIEYADGVNWNPGYGEGLYVYKGGVWVPFGVGAGGRLRLNTATNFYFDTAAGNDANPGTSVLPWQSPAPLWSRIDFGNQAVTLNLKNNTTSRVTIQPWTGGGSLALDLGAHSVTYAGVDPTDGAINVTNGALPGPLTLQNGTFNSSTGASTLFCSTLLVQSASTVVVGTGVAFGAAGFAQINTLNGGAVVRLVNSFSLSGNAQYFIFGNSGEIANFAVPITITATGAISYAGAVVDSSTGALVILSSLVGRKVTWGNPGNFTGVRFNADANGILNTQGGGINFIPGTIAGTTSSGGQYL